MWHEFSPRNPLRPADWRWRRALASVEGQLPLSRRRDDAWVQRAVKFMKAHRSCHSALELARLEDLMPDVFWAHSLYTVGEEKGKSPRSALEARLMANTPFADIAQASGLEVGAIEAYESLFFNVLEAVRAWRTDWLLHCVMGPAVARGLSDREFDLFWKLMSLFGGPHAATRFIQGLDRPAQPQEANNTGAFVQDAIFSMFQTRAAQTHATLVSNGFTQGDIVANYREWLKMEREQGGARSSEASVMAGIGQMLTAFTFQVGPDKLQRNPRLALADKRAAEPNNAEVLAYSAGADYVIDPELADLKFPAEVPV